MVLLEVCLCLHVFSHSCLIFLSPAKLWRLISLPLYHFKSKLQLQWNYNAKQCGVVFLYALCIHSGPLEAASYNSFGIQQWSMSPKMLPVKFWQPSAASLSHFSPSPSKESASVIEPLPVVILFIQSITASSCIISNLSYIYRWVTGVSWSSQVSSRAKEKKPKFSALLFNWNSRFTTMCSVHLVTEGCILK